MLGLERAQHLVHVEAREQGFRAADVVEVAMAQHETIDVRVAACPQQRHQHALAGVALARILRAGVEHQHVAARADQHRRALADVGGDQVEAAFWRQRAWRQEERQRERHGQKTQAPRQRRDEQRRRQQPCTLRPCRRHRHDPDGARQAGEHREVGIEEPHRLGAEAPERRQRNTQQSERRDHERDGGNRNDVRREADERDLLEEQQGQRREAERRDDLGAQVALQQGPEAPQPTGHRAGFDSDGRRHQSATRPP